MVQIAKEDRNKFPEPKIVDMSNPANVIAEKIRNIYRRLPDFGDNVVTRDDLKNYGEELAKELEDANLVPNINYQGLYDEADVMAELLRDIENEVHTCAMCEHDGPGGYSAHDLLEKICYLFYKHPNYHNNPRYKPIVCNKDCNDSKII